MRCPECGTEIREGARFCQKCGCEILVAQTEQKAGNNGNRIQTISIITAVALVIIAIAVICVIKGIHRDKGISTSDEETVKVEQGAMGDEDTSANSETESTVGEAVTDDEVDSEVSYDTLMESYIQEIEDLKEESVRLIKENAPYYAQYFNPDSDLLLNLADVDGDGIYELFTSEITGYIAWMSVYHNGEVIRYTLYNNYEKHDDYTDYGAYAYIDCENNRIIKCEYDCTLVKDGGNSQPGSEILEETSPYDYYTYISIYRLDDNKAMEYIEGYSSKAHYEADTYEIVSVTKNGEQIDELPNFYKMSDIDFGSAQAQGDGITADKMESLLNGICKASHDFITGQIRVDGLFADIYADDMDSDVFGIYFYDVDNDDEYELLISKYYGYDIYDYRNGNLLYLTGVDGTAAACSIYKHGSSVYICHSDTTHGGRQLYTFDKYNGEGDITETIEIDAEYWDQSEPDENSDYTYCGQSITMDEYNRYLSEFYELPFEECNRPGNIFINYPCEAEIKALMSTYE